MKSWILVLGLCAGCSTTPRCGDLVGARVVYVGPRSCDVRIRQVTIASQLKIPESLKKAELAGLRLQWVDPRLVDGQVIMGHFVLASKDAREDRNQ